MLGYVLVRQMSQGNFTKCQLISCLGNRCHHPDRDSQLWSQISFTHYNKSPKFLNSTQNRQSRFQFQVDFFFFWMQNSRLCWFCNSFGKRRRERTWMETLKRHEAWSSAFSSAWQKKTAPNCYLNSLSVQICFNKRVSSSTISKHDSDAWKNLMQLEQPLRFLPTGALLLGALDGLLTLKIRREQEPKQTPQIKVHTFFVFLSGQPSGTACYFTTKRILQRRV